MLRSSRLRLKGSTSPLTKWCIPLSETYLKGAGAMPESEKKGITVKVDAELHAKVKEYIESHGITMAEFVSQALDNELRPREVQGMGVRTIAFQVPNELFDQIKDYLNRHNMTQKEFMLGLINAELARDQQQTMSEEQEEELSEDYSEDEEMTMNMG